MHVIRLNKIKFCTIDLSEIPTWSLPLKKKDLPSKTRGWAVTNCWRILEKC